ncbi:MAG: HDIG domain-containing metalloprotein [Gaiellales bacterium]
MTVDADPRLARAIEPVRAAFPAGDVWLVGGAVRDVLLGRPLTDWDLVTTGDAEAIARAHATALGVPVFPLSERHGTWRVVGDAGDVDVTAAPEGITADLLRRDLTVNAIAVRLADGEVVAVPGALDDIDARVLRAVADHSFRDDPLRLLRLVRLATELELEIDPDTAVLARRDAALAADPAGERQRAELERILLSRDPVDGLRRLDDLGILAVVLPELKALEGVEQNRYHHLDVLDHSLQVLDAAIDLVEHPEFAFGPAAAAVAAALAEELDADTDVALAVRWGALLHDVAKPHTRHVFDDGHVGFPGHAQQGAEMAMVILARLRCSTALQRCVAVLVREHLRLGFLVSDGELDRRGVHRYRVETEPWSIASVIVSLADRWSTRGTRARQRWIRRHEQTAAAMALALAEPPLPPLVRGDDLAAALGQDPGPEIGRLLALIAEEQAAGELTTADQAIAFARTAVDEA